MQSESEILESLKCPICIDFADDPMECIHCNNIFCRNCLGNSNPIKIKCPTCRKDPNFKESAFARRLLANVPADCPNACTVKLTRLDIKIHLSKCENRPYECTECDFKDKKKVFLEHLFEKHETEIIARFNKIDFLASDALKISQLTINNKNEIIPVPQLNSPLIEQVAAQNNILKNKNGYEIKKGKNGKYYCGRPLGFKCHCCDGNCGPDDGCCCAACMEYTCQSKNLQPGALVNNKGRNTFFFKGNFYCGTEIDNIEGRSSLMKSIFNSKRNAKCQFPQHPCIDCQAVTNLTRYYLSDELRGKLMMYG
jgi:hypothetical protein